MFSILGCIVVGDKTSCGGTVVSGSMTDDIDGKPISRVGDQVSCRHSCNIMTGDNAWIIAGQPVAIHGSLTTRQCTCISAAHNNHAGVGQTQAQQDAVPKAADSGIAFAPVMQGIEQEVHWLEFSLKNKSGMRVVTASKEAVYDYGRYGDTWGIGSSEGEGVLQIWSNFNAYIAEENSLHRLTTAYLYPVTEAKAQEVMAFYEAKIKGKKVRSSTASMKSYLIDDYYALGPNCTTLSVSAAKVAIPDIDREWATYQQGRGLGTMEKTIVSTRGWPKYIFMPADLQEMLSKSVVRKPKSVSTYGGN